MMAISDKSSKTVLSMLQTAASDGPKIQVLGCDEDSQKLQNNGDKGPTILELMMTAQQEAQKLSIVSKKTIPNSQLGGFKKGFFANKPASTTKSKSNTIIKSDMKPGSVVIPTIVPQSSSNCFVLHEVQEAMKETNPILSQLKQGEWVNESLTEKLQQNPILSSGLRNPKCMAAMQLMQTDPKEAKNRFSNDPDVSLFLQEFGRVMSEHFYELGSKQQEQEQEQEEENRSGQHGAAPNCCVAPSSSRIVELSEGAEASAISSNPEVGPIHAQVLQRKLDLSSSLLSNTASTERNDESEIESRRVEDILQDAELRELLLDVKMQKILLECNNPVKFKQHIKDPAVAKKIKKLFDAGLVGTTL